MVGLREMNTRSIGTDVLTPNAKILLAATLPRTVVEPGRPTSQDLSLPEKLVVHLGKRILEAAYECHPYNDRVYTG